MLEKVRGLRKILGWPRLRKRLLWKQFDLTTESRRARSWRTGRFFL